MELEEFIKFDSVKYWLESMAGRAEGSKKAYLYHFKAFCDWMDKSPDALISEREQHLKSEDKKIQRTMEMAVKRYNAYLDDQDAGAGTKVASRAAIKSFFEHHYMPLQFIRGDFPTEAMMERRKVEKDEILKMLEEAGVRDRALIHVLKDSGLAVSDVARLRIRHLFPPTKISPITAEDIQSLPDFILISEVRKKTKAKIRTFLGREAVQALKFYLERRLRGTRKMPPEALTFDSPLFRIVSGKRIQPMSRKRMIDAVKDIARRVGIKGISAHSFRKYTQTMLEVARIEPNWRKLILGKKLPGSEASYSMPSDQDLQKTYEEAYQHIQVIERLSLEELQKRQQIVEVLMDKITRGEAFTDEDRANVKRYGIQLRERAGRMIEENEASEDCQRIVTEEQLEEYLRRGWRVVTALPSGKIVISNEGNA